MNVWIEASNLFPPHILVNYLEKTPDGVAIVNKDKLLADRGTIPLLCVAMNDHYRWSYSDWATSTIYFEAGDNCIYGGIYDTEKGKTTRRIIAKTHLEKMSAHVVFRYSEDEMQEMMKLIS